MSAAEPAPDDPPVWDGLDVSPTLVELEAEAVAAAEADPESRRELTLVTPEIVERAAETRRRHDEQLLALGPVARYAHEADCPLCIGRALPVPPGPDGFARSIIAGLTVVTAPELVAEPEPEADAMLGGLLPAPGVSILAGDPKSMKTMAALNLAVGIASGCRALGREMPPGPVLVVEEEGARRRIAERVTLMSAGLGVAPPAALYLALHQSVRLDVPASLRALDATITAVRPRLVVLDPLVMLHSLDENRPSEMARVMRPLIEFAAHHEAAVLVVHHVTKPQAERRNTRLAQRLRGASSFAGATDANIVLDREDERVVRLRAEYRDADPLELWLALDPATLLLETTEKPEPEGAKVPRPELVAFVREHGTVGAARVADHFGASINAAKSALFRASDAGLLDHFTDRRMGHKFMAREGVNGTR